jgi:6-pyruvoyltetrahydropterin/6-carboxytetrahydropterin synthase
LDNVGRVIDFSVIKKRLCLWLEEQWDHQFLMWTEDPWKKWISDPKAPSDFAKSVRLVDFNPTAENIALYLLKIVGPIRLAGTGVTLYKVTVQETRKCAATAEL